MKEIERLSKRGNTKERDILMDIIIDLLNNKSERDG